MPRRDRAEQRRKPRRAPRPAVLIFCGAEKTEMLYFAGLRDHLESGSIDIVLAEKAGAPDQVVGFAAAYGDKDGFDERWCILDVDHYERLGGKVSRAIALSRSNGIRLAISNPCFEYWLLLHHADRASPAHLCRDIETLLRKHVADYDKTRLKFSEFAPGLAEAIDRARKRDPSGVEHELNPSSGVWLLVEKLMEQKK